MRRSIAYRKSRRRAPGAINALIRFFAGGTDYDVTRRRYAGTRRTRSNAVDGTSAPVDGAPGTGIDVVAVLAARRRGVVAESEQATNALAQGLADRTIAMEALAMVWGRLPGTARALGSMMLGKPKSLEDCSGSTNPVVRATSIGYLHRLPRY